MGITAENVAKKYEISREKTGHARASLAAEGRAAQEAGRFKDEIVAVRIAQKKATRLSSQAMSSSIRRPTPKPSGPAPRIRPRTAR